MRLRGESEQKYPSKSKSEYNKEAKSENKKYQGENDKLIPRTIVREEYKI